MQARYYEPGAGRFGAEDPIRDGLNWYGYCDANPVSYFDPLGLGCTGEITNSFNEMPLACPCINISKITEWDKRNLSREELAELRRLNRIIADDRRHGDRLSPIGIRAARDARAIRKQAIENLGLNANVLDCGHVYETISQTVFQTGINHSVGRPRSGPTTVSTTITFQRLYTCSGVYIRLINVSGRVLNNTGPLRDVNISSTFGQTGLPLRNEMHGYIDINWSSFNFDVGDSSWIGDTGVDTATRLGAGVTFNFSNSSGTITEQIEIVNRVYYQTGHFDFFDHVTVIDIIDTITDSPRRGR